MTRAFVLVETQIGMAKKAAEKIAAQNGHNKLCHVMSAETVTGPYDVLVTLEGAHLDAISDCVVQTIQTIEGVQRTTTCLAAKLT